mmetsp:Transcript_71141/g.189904  ORF Transcript_71141/g.189904 Transcript_71141/m.189904 type:complete len:248 (-) Transcript_71141:34-777(-)
MQSFPRSDGPFKCWSERRWSGCGDHIGGLNQSKSERNDEISLINLELFRDKRREDARRLSIGCARYLAQVSKPCRCSGLTSFGDCHLWHNYRPLKESVDDLIQRLALEYEDSTGVILAIAPSILRFCKSEGINLCKDQFLRLISVAVCVNCKFWDDKAPFFRQNSRISAATGIPLADFNAMEMAFLRGLGWNICMGPEDFDHWSRVIEDCAEAQRKETEERREAERRYQSPTDVAELADSLARMART